MLSRCKVSKVTPAAQLLQENRTSITRKEKSKLQRADPRLGKDRKSNLKSRSVVAIEAKNRVIRVARDLWVKMASVGVRIVKRRERNVDSGRRNSIKTT